mgnify:CR=1 FL=1
MDFDTEDSLEDFASDGEVISQPGQDPGPEIEEQNLAPSLTSNFLRFLDQKMIIFFTFFEHPLGQQHTPTPPPTTNSPHLPDQVEVPQQQQQPPQRAQQARTFREEQELTDAPPEAGEPDQRDRHWKRKTWFITLWSPSWTEEDILARLEQHAELFFRETMCRDIAPDTGRVHWHLAVETFEPVTWKTLKDIFPHDAAIGKIKTNYWYSREYIHGRGSSHSEKHVVADINPPDPPKEDRDEHGNKIPKYKTALLALKKNPTRDTWDAITDEDPTLLRWNQLADEVIAKGVRDNFKFYRLKQLAPEDQPYAQICVIWIFGQTGSGKTRLAEQLLYTLPWTFASTTISPNGQIVDYPNGTRILLFNDINPKHVKKDPQVLLTISEAGTGGVVDRKGSKAVHDAYVVIFTRIEDYMDWDKDKDFHDGGWVAQFDRRVIFKVHCEKTARDDGTFQFTQYDTKHQRDFSVQDVVDYVKHWCKNYDIPYPEPADQ